MWCGFVFLDKSFCDAGQNGFYIISHISRRLLLQIMNSDNTIVGKGQIPCLVSVNFIRANLQELFVKLEKVEGGTLLGFGWRRGDASFLWHVECDIIPDHWERLPTSVAFGYEVICDGVHTIKCRAKKKTESIFATCMAYKGPAGVYQGYQWMLPALRDSLESHVYSMDVRTHKDIHLSNPPKLAFQFSRSQSATWYSYLRTKVQARL